MRARLANSLVFISRYVPGLPIQLRPLERYLLDGAPGAIVRLIFHVEAIYYPAEIKPHLRQLLVNPLQLTGVGKGTDRHMGHKGVAELPAIYRIFGELSQYSFIKIYDSLGIGRAKIK